MRWQKVGKPLSQFGETLSQFGKVLSQFGEDWQGLAKIGEDCHGLSALQMVEVCYNVYCQRWREGIGSIAAGAFFLPILMILSFGEDDAY